MTVRELIELLGTFNPDLLVCYRLWSEQCLLEKDDLRIKRLGKPRPDGWVPDERPDQETIEYLQFPGN